MKLSLRLSAATLLFGILPTHLSLAQSTSGFYLKVDGGINYIQDTSLTIGGYGGEMSLDAGFRLMASGGYYVNRWLAVELEGGYFESNIGTVTLRDMTAHPDKTDYSGVPILANVLLRYENSSSFVPFIGLGAGGIRSTLRISGQTDDQFVYGLQAQVGVIYKIDDEAWLEIGYRLLGMPKQSYDLSGLSIETDKVLSHFFGIGAIWKF
jgi:opacity protein-like surface antigen